MTALRFDGDGLIPAVVQHAGTGAVLMVGWMNAEALRRTRESGVVWFWSRSRGALWQKGETSGNVLRVVEIRRDCDDDVLLVLADPAGPTCHTNEPSCFYRALDSETTLPPAAPGALFADLFAVIEERRRERPAGSYTAALFDRGIDTIAKKVGEEASEVIIAAKNGDPGPLAGEVADLWYHTLVLLAACGLTPDAVLAVLRERRSAPRRSAE
ncbi:MAG: bifunctional phosphoribosyl-AMP cyclohydrolase/phosphoribosyl-ATP diphosphatase HisIE [Chloroflexota bacterium]|nr:bifunctional phosphoribosyl-AMP cyclohydrolase/phosphoribosyl-ATP diphosphatase HisIE [Dehalococcoidia bacterium]MDW8255111.1 bifunctional phosphoribosyl-AMP cyclohydrolase/phosphoribosyl-ATP diphosphatase HisIE [Chloroflexota bacterium]